MGRLRTSTCISSQSESISPALMMVSALMRLMIREEPRTLLSYAATFPEGDAACVHCEGRHQGGEATTGDRSIKSTCVYSQGLVTAGLHRRAGHHIQTLDQATASVHPKGARSFPELWPHITETSCFWEEGVLVTAVLRAVEEMTFLQTHPQGEGGFNLALPWPAPQRG